MTSRTLIAYAGNVLASAHAVLEDLGYAVSHVPLNGGSLLQAEKDNCRFLGDDPVVILGLIKMFDERGSDWPATDAEVERFLSFDSGGPDVSNTD